MADIALSIRTRYSAARAHLIVSTKALEDIKVQAQTLQTVAQKATGLRARAAAVVEELGALGKDIEIDLSDEALGSMLTDDIARVTHEAAQELGMTVTKAAPRSVPSKGVVHAPSVAASPSAAGIRPPPPEDPPADAAPAPSGAAPAPAAAPPPPPGPAANGAAAPAVPGGRISTVTPRARRALSRVAKPTRGDTGRADAMKDDEGRQIPVNEQIVIDSDAPVPEGARREEGDTANPGTIKPPDDEPESA